MKRRRKKGEDEEDGEGGGEGVGKVELWEMKKVRWCEVLGVAIAERERSCVFGLNFGVCIVVEFW